MKQIAFALLGVTVLAATTVPADAISRIRADQTSCSTILERIDREGAVLLRYPSKRVANYILYDRYVAADRFCPFRNQEARPDPVETKDDARCPVMTCQRKIEIFPPLFDRHR